MYNLYHNLIALLVLGFISWGNFSHSQTHPKFTPKSKAELISALDQIVKYQAIRLGVPGGAFGVVLDGEVVLKNVAGPRRLSDKTPVNSETLFQIGSIAKSFSATIAVNFHLQNKLKLDQPIKIYLPKRCPQKQCDGITIQNLLNHTSGIPADGINEQIESGDSYDTIVTQALNAKKRCAPGKCFDYNNAAYDLVREILEKIENKPYLEILKSEILAPLEMKNTSGTFAKLTESNNYFVPHIFINGSFYETSYSTGYYQFPASSILNSNLDDMLKFVAAELGNRPKVISTEALKLLHTPTTEAPDAYRWWDRPAPGQEMRSGYGLGHRMFTAPDFTVVFHTGWIKGSKSLIALFPDRNLGIVLMQNSASQLGIRVLEDVVHYLRNGKVK